MPYDPSSKLPPEIANFVTKVRNRSLDGADPTVTQQSQHGGQASGEIQRPLNEVTVDGQSAAAERIQRVPLEVPPTYDVPRSSVSPTYDPLKVEVSEGVAASQYRAPSTPERVTITPDGSEDQRRSGSLSAPRQNGRPKSTEIPPTAGAYPHPTSATVYPEAYHPGGVQKEQDGPRHGTEPERGGGGGGLRGSGGQRPGSGGGTMYTYAHYRQSSQDKRDQQQQQQLQQQQTQHLTSQNPQQSLSWDTERVALQQQQHQHQQQQQMQHLVSQNPQLSLSWDAERAKREALQQQQHQHQQYQLRSQPATNAPSKNSSMSLPRGQMMRYETNPHSRHESHGSSDGSTPTTPHAQSDMAIPRTQARSPTGHAGGAPDSLGYRYPHQPYTGQQPNPRSRNYHPQQQMGYYPPPQDIRRTQTFSMGQGPSRPTHAQQYHQHLGGEDSLPNSPTYFSQNPPHVQDRGTLSPNTLASNKSFQKHLETLNTTRHGRKMRVLDWMQKQQQVESSQMVRDLSAEVPSQPYQKQDHIYASAAELDPPVHMPNLSRPGSAQEQGSYQAQERGRLHTFPYIHSSAHAQRPPPVQARSQVDRGRKYVNVLPHAPTTTGTHVSPQPPMGVGGISPQPPMGTGGNMGRVAVTGSPANAQNLPTAKFEKDYYILDV